MLPETDQLQNGRLSVTLKHSHERKKKKKSGERMSFALGDGSFLLLEEIDNGHEDENNPMLINLRKPDTRSHFSSASTEQGPPKLSVAELLPPSSSNDQGGRILCPGRDIIYPKPQARVTLPERHDVREGGPLKQEYA